MDRYVHIPELDGIRAIAVLMVFIYHAWGNSGIPKLNIFGWDITFLLSWGILVLICFMFIVVSYYLYLLRIITTTQINALYNQV